MATDLWEPDGPALFAKYEGRPGANKGRTFFAAVILLVTLQTGLLQLNVNSTWQVGVVGVLLIVVLFVDRFASGRA